ncbi:MAG: adenylyl-sulfate kinase, partial [Marinilabiliaceae bacterium]|nr:adenylyl-sulfate kinase [Marinilabiliaceae bacterium]
LTQVLDGDNVRTGINNNLGFSEEDRKENIRRIAEINKLFLNCGVITINAFISPTNDIRRMVLEIIGTENFIEVFEDAPVEICIQRDPKGLYKKAMAGEIKNFTGIDASFDQPDDAEVKVNTSQLGIEEGVKKAFSFIIERVKKETANNTKNLRSRFLLAK